ncbi:MAG: hypothetical protein Q8T13_17200 [Acidobacteriota bacterium]|nr:hypothetical protein [Acidobacteriota bacterium]
MSFAAMLAARFVGVPFAPIVHSLLEGVELSITQSPSQVLRVSSLSDRPLGLHALRGILTPGVNAYTPEEDAGTVYVDVTKVPGLLIRTSSGYVALASADEGLELAAIVKPIPLVPLAVLDPPVLQWAKGITDSWLLDQITAKVASHNTWSRVVAAGMLARLAIPPGSEDARASVQAFFGGVVDEKLAAPRRWARSLTPHETHSIQEMALAEGDALQSELESFELEVNEHVTDWHRQWLDLRYRRDDLECVLVLLDESEHGTPLRAAMLELDREGDLVRLSVPPHMQDDDERLRRAALLAIASWWATPLSAG